MSEPIVENIAAALFTRLQAVTTGNGYQQTLAALRPTSTARDITPMDLRAVLLQLDATPAEESDIPGNPNAQAWWQLFVVCVYLRPSDTDSVPIDTRVNRVTADVIKAISAPANWETFGGNAINARFPPPARFEHESGDHEGVCVFVDVCYRTDEKNPYNVR